MAIGNRLPTKGNVHWFIYPLNAFANYKAPTVTELNANFDVVAASNAISYNDTDFGVQASETLDDPSYAAKGVTLSRGSSNYGGTLSFYYPEEFDDNTNSLSRFYDMLEQRTEWYVVERIDGELGWQDPWEEGHLGTIFKIMVAGEAQNIVGQDAFRYNITSLPRGEMEVNFVVAESTGEVEVIIDSIDDTLTVGDKGIATGLVKSGTKERLYTQGLKWSSSDTDVVTVTKNGVLVAHGGGTATITAEYEPTGDTASETVTVS